MTVESAGIVTLLIVNILIMTGFVINREVEMVLTMTVLPLNVLLGPLLKPIRLCRFQGSQ